VHSRQVESSIRLRELSTMRLVCRQQRVAAGLAQEELQRVGRRLVRGLEWGGAGSFSFSFSGSSGSLRFPPFELVEIASVSSASS